VATKRISSRAQKLRKEQRKRNLGRGKYKQRSIQIMQAERKNGIAMFKPGRYAEYYPFKGKIKVPYYFLSIEKERTYGMGPGMATGSTPGYFIREWAEKHGKNFESLDKHTPQIMMIPKEEIREHLMYEIGLAHNPQNLQELATRPFLIEPMKNTVRNALAGIDWVERTYGIRIEVPKDVLEWVGKVKKPSEKK
jgi:hypothetical protein